jgi:ATP-binding cassette subfamily B protein
MASEKPTTEDDLPPSISSMVRLLKLGYQHEPGLLGAALGLTLLAALPDALIALWLKVLSDGVQARDHTKILVAALGLGISATATWLLKTISTRVQRRFRDKVSIALVSHVARLQANVSTIAHQERPELLDHMHMSIFSTAGWVLRLGVTLALLTTIHSALLLLSLFAVPTMLSSTWRPGIERQAEEQAVAQLGATWPHGVDLSFGHWHELSLARPSTRCSSACRNRQAGHRRRPDHRPGLAPLQHRADG